jgi:hypothetical protein
VSADAQSKLGATVQLQADVTSLVEAGGAGTWRLADVALAKGGGQAWAGWALTVVVTDPAQQATQRVTLYAGDLSVASADQTSQQVAAPDMALTAMQGVVWGVHQGDPAASAWLIDATGDTALSQGYQVKSVTPSGYAVQVLSGGQAFFPLGSEKPSPALDFRSAKDAGKDQHVGLLGVVAPLPTAG